MAVAVVAIVLGATLSGTLAAARRFGPDPVREALRREAGRELRIAVDLLKYQGASIAPASVSTSIPMPASSTLSARISIAVSPLPLGGTAVAVTAQSGEDARETVTLQSVILHPAPLPSATVQTGLFVPAPAGAQ